MESYTKASDDIGQGYIGAIKQIAVQQVTGMRENPIKFVAKTGENLIRNYTGLAAAVAGGVLIGDALEMGHNWYNEGLGIVVSFIGAYEPLARKDGEPWYSHSYESLRNAAACAVGIVGIPVQPLSFIAGTFVLVVEGGRITNEIVDRSKEAIPLEQSVHA